MRQLEPLVKLVITTGEPAGIGPEVSIVAAKQFLLEQPNASITLLGDQTLLKEALHGSDDDRLRVEVVHLIAPSIPGVLDAQNTPTNHFKFYDVFPISLDPVQLEATAMDVNYVIGSATFKYSYFTIDT